MSGQSNQVRSDYGASFYFVQNNENDVVDAKYSYIKMSGGMITDIREKVGISHFANTGAYGFPSAHALLVTCEAILDSVGLHIAAGGGGGGGTGGRGSGGGGGGGGGSGTSSPRLTGSPEGGGDMATGGAAPAIYYPGRTYVSNAIKVLMEAGTAFVGIHVPSFACVARQDQLEDFLYHVKVND